MAFSTTAGADDLGRSRGLVGGVANRSSSLQDAELAARATADKARKASAYSALWLFVSLLVGAFIASLSATFGGRQRDA